MPKLEIDIDTETNRELTTLDRTDLPEKLAITLARQAYPFLDDVLTKLTHQAQAHAKKEVDKLFREGLTTDAE